MKFKRIASVATFNRAVVLLAFVLWIAQFASAAGVTIITHGFQPNSIDHGHGWVEAMGDYIADRAGGTKYIYRVEITNGYPTSATNPHGLGLGSFTCQNSGLQPIHQSENAEVVIKI